MILVHGGNIIVPVYYADVANFSIRFTLQK